MKWFLLPIFIAGCNPVHQNLAELKQELDYAKVELTTVQNRVVKLEEEIAKKEIARIQKEIEEYQKKASEKILSHDERLAFFSQQREILSQIIKNQTTCAFQAQVVLDQILTMITKMSDTALD